MGLKKTNWANFYYGAPPGSVFSSFIFFNSDTWPPHRQVGKLHFHRCPGAPLNHRRPKDDDRTMTIESCQTYPYGDQGISWHLWGYDMIWYDMIWYWLVVNGCHEFYFPINIGLLSSSQLTFIFFRGVAQPPTRYRYTQDLTTKCGLNYGHWPSFKTIDLHVTIPRLLICLSLRRPEGSRDSKFLKCDNLMSNIYIYIPTISYKIVYHIQK